jgi:hypothetical protein
MWLGLAVAMAAITYRIADWFKVPDEMVFQRLGMSIWRDHSLVPRIHGEFIRSLNQLYPLLISPIVGSGYVADDLPQIRVLNAVLVTSACIPAYLLARRVTGRRWAGYLLGALSVCVPWVVLASFMLTEVVALPVFLWAVLAFQRSLVLPSVRNDVIALGAIVLAFTARTQFVLLLGVLPLAVLAYELPRDGLRLAVVRHRVLAAFYGMAAVGALAFTATGGNLLTLSIYGDQFTRGAAPTAVPGWALGHLADLAFGIGLLPVLVAAAWLLANVARPPAGAEPHAFACIAIAALLVTTYAATTFDLQLGGFIFDRYLFYVVPLLLLALACALLDERRPRWSLVPPVAAVALGFVLHLQQSFTWSDARVNSDTPISIFYGPFADLAGSRGALAALLAGATVALAGLFALAAARLPHRQLLVGLLAAVAFGLPAATGYTFYRHFSVEGYSGRPITESGRGVLDWVDRRVGPDARVTIVPSPVSSSFLVTQSYWRDIQFWNKSVDAHLLNPTSLAYAYTGPWFPKTVPRLDERSGAVGPTLTRYALQSVGESRFRIAGTVIQQTQQAMLIDALRPWRLAWRTFGLYEDGWTRPDETARVRVYASAGGGGAVTHYLSLQLQTPPDVPSRAVTVVSNLERRQVDVAREDTAVVQGLLVCVPAGGYADVELRAAGASLIGGDQGTLADSLIERRGGIHVTGIAVGDETAGACAT